MKEWCSEIPGGIRLAVQIAPNAKKNEVMGLFDNTLKIRLQAQPIEGRANEALIHFLAERLELPKSMITITHGHTNKRKILEIRSTVITLAAAKKILFRC